METGVVFFSLNIRTFDAGIFIYSSLNLDIHSQQIFTLIYSSAYDYKKGTIFI